MKTIIYDKARKVGKYEMRYMLFEVTDGGRKYYSFCIEQHSDEGDEEDEVVDICDTMEEAVGLFERLISDGVMPASLSAIAEDYIFEKTCVN